MHENKIKYDPQLLLMSEPWAKAYMVLHSHPRRTVDQKRRFYRWFHLVLPKGVLRRYLVG